MDLNQSLPVPFVQKELPNTPPPSKLPGQLRPEPEDFSQGGELPDLGIPSFAQDLGEQADLLGMGRGLKAVPQLLNRHGFVPEEVRDCLGIIQIAGERRARLSLRLDHEDILTNQRHAKR
ncbi:MAG TPA: hypothetical protein VLE27_08665, partial [Thermoanaerobaculia bacterium]|nr:hypothetical protein [Thermoanaerobaculia bacterium]